MLEPVQRRARLEGQRYAAALKQQTTQHSTVLLHWGALWRQLSSPCGPWALRWVGLGWGRGLERREGGREDLEYRTPFGVRPGKNHLGCICRDLPTPRWKMSSVETYSRMRLKLVPNHHFNSHLEASALRDNLGERVC